MPDVKLTVNGKIYGGWQEVEIEQSIECAAGSFRLSVSDRWSGQDDPWPINPGDVCTVSIDGTVVITGFVDRRSIAYDAASRTMSVEGRDKTGDLVDCSVRLAVWGFHEQRVDRVVEKVCAQFGVKVSVSPGITPPTMKDWFAVSYGETAWEVIEKACRLSGVLAMPDTKGGLLLTRPPQGRATDALIEGKNIKAATGSYDASARYRTYYAGDQVPGDDESQADDVTGVEGSATDLGGRAGRTLLIHTETNATPQMCKDRAAWEATVRAARANKVTVIVQGWQQADGTLWPLNSSVRVTSPWLGVNADMVLAERRLSLSISEGTIAELTLTSPNAYVPEPVIPKSFDAYAGELSGND